MPLCPDELPFILIHMLSILIAILLAANDERAVYRLIIHHGPPRGDEQVYTYWDERKVQGSSALVEVDAPWAAERMRTIALDSIDSKHVEREWREARAKRIKKGWVDAGYAEIHGKQVPSQEVAYANRARELAGLPPAASGQTSSPPDSTAPPADSAPGVENGQAPATAPDPASAPDGAAPKPETLQAGWLASSRRLWAARIVVLAVALTLGVLIAKRFIFTVK